jgi:DNA-binding response OmpR family regulator
MALMVVADDDPGTLKLVGVVLRNQGHEVLPAADGLTAWTLVREHGPDVIVSDVNMPGLNGFELLQRVREHPDTGLTPFVLLTSLQERRDMRQGMTLGADDYITKPLRPRELQDAVTAQLGRQQMRHAARNLHLQTALSEALEEQAWALQEQFEKRLARELSEQWPGQSAHQGESTYPHATVLFADILHYPQWLGQLSAAEMGQLLKRFFEHSGDTVHLFGAATLQFVGEGLLAVFADPSASTTAPHGLRAAKAALGLRKAGAGMDVYVKQRWPGRRLPPFELGIALHSGPVAMAQLDGLLGGHQQRIPVGETVVDTMALQRHARPAAGAITVSVPVLRSITGAVRPLTRYLLNLPHRSEPMDVCSVEPLPH